MRPQNIIEELKRQPFQPFHIHLFNGRAYEVRHPEFVMVGKHTLLIGNPTEIQDAIVFDKYEVVDLIHINNLEKIAVPAPPATNGPSA